MYIKWEVEESGMSKRKEKKTKANDPVIMVEQLPEVRKSENDKQALHSDFTKIYDILRHNNFR